MKLLHTLLASFLVLFAVSFVIPASSPTPTVSVSTEQLVEMHVAPAQIGGLVACTPQMKSVLKTAVDVVGYLCIVANVALPSVAAVAEACQLDSALAPDIQKIIDDFKAKRAAYAKEQMAAAHCSAGDGGK